jgi:hypothetical protein
MADAERHRAIIALLLDQFVWHRGCPPAEPSVRFLDI